jgi:hypothetical protein
VHIARHIFACIGLVALQFVLAQSSYLPGTWINIIPPAIGTIFAFLVGRVSLEFVIVTLIIVGPIMVLSVLFLIAGVAWPGDAAAHVKAHMSVGSFLAVLSPPVVGAVTWLAIRHLTNHSSGRAKARAA